MQQFSLFFSIFTILSLFSFCNAPSDKEQAIQNTPTVLLSTLQHAEMMNTYLKNSNRNTIASMKEVAKSKLQYMPLRYTGKTILQNTSALDESINQLKSSIDLKGYLQTALQTGNTSPPSTYKESDQQQVASILLSQQGQDLYQQLTQIKTEQLLLIGNLWENGGMRGTIFVQSYQKEDVLRQLSKEWLLPFKEDHSQEAWLKENFEGKTIEEAYLTLLQLQNKLHLSTNNLLRFLSEQVSRYELSYDRFNLVMDAPNTTIQLGETFTADILLGAYSSTADFEFSVNGQEIPQKDGQGLYKVTPSSIGKKTIELKIKVKNKMTGVTDIFRKNYTYEVVK